VRETHALRDLKAEDLLQAVAQAKPVDAPAREPGEPITINFVTQNVEHNGTQINARDTRARPGVWGLAAMNKTPLGPAGPGG